MRSLGSAGAASARSRRAVGRSVPNRRGLGQLIAALRVLHEEQTYQELGYSSFPQYCERELGISKSTAYEWLSTGIRFDHLPGTRALHAEGDLSWEQTREIVRVATAETEKESAQFAIDHSPKGLRAGVKDAQEREPGSAAVAGARVAERSDEGRTRADAGRARTVRDDATRTGRSR